MSVDVFLQNHWQHPVGHLTAHNARHVFSYEPSATAAISLSMPIRNESFVQDAVLHPIFQMNLPEGTLREAIERTTAKLYGSDDLSMLTILGPYQIGGLAYAQKSRPPMKTAQHDFDLNTLLKKDDGNLFSELLDRFATYSGVAGVQPKVLMDLPRVTVQNKSSLSDKSVDQLQYSGHVTLPFAHYIVKSWGDEYPHLACNEFFCLKVAKASGLTIPNFYLSDNAKLLISQRFDIDAAGKALGFEDFCVLQGKTTKQKYDASLESCAKTIRQFISPEHLHQALYDFYKLCYLNIILRNGDAHLKNMGILYSQLKDYHANSFPTTERVLSPFFDIVSTIPYLKNDIMALSITGSKRWPKPKVLHAFGQQHCFLKKTHIHTIENEVNHAIQSQLPLLKLLIEKYPEFAEIGLAMSSSIEKAMADWLTT